MKGDIMNSFFENLYANDSSAMLYVYLVVVVLIIIIIFIIILLSIKSKSKKQINENKIDKDILEQTKEITSLAKSLPKKETKSAEVKKLEITQELIREDMKEDAHFSPVYLEAKDKTLSDVKPNYILPPEPEKKETASDLIQTDELEPLIEIPNPVQEEIIETPEIPEPAREEIKIIDTPEIPEPIEEEIKIIETPQTFEVPEIISKPFVEEPEIENEPVQEEPKKDIDLSIDILKASLNLKPIVEDPVLEEAPILPAEEPVKEVPPKLTMEDLQTRLARLQEKTKTKDNELSSILENMGLSSEELEKPLEKEEEQRFLGR